MLRPGDEATAGWRLARLPAGKYAMSIGYDSEAAGFGMGFVVSDTVEFHVRSEGESSLLREYSLRRQLAAATSFERMVEIAEAISVLASDDWAMWESVAIRALRDRSADEILKCYDRAVAACKLRLASPAKQDAAAASALQNRLPDLQIYRAFYPQYRARQDEWRLERLPDGGFLVRGRDDGIAKGVLSRSHPEILGDLRGNVLRPKE